MKEWFTYVSATYLNSISKVTILKLVLENLFPVRLPYPSNATTFILPEIRFSTDTYTRFE